MGPRRPRREHAARVELKHTASEGNQIGLRLRIAFHHVHGYGRSFVHHEQEQLLAARERLFVLQLSH